MKSVGSSSVISLLPFFKNGSHFRGEMIATFSVMGEGKKCLYTKFVILPNILHFLNYVIENHGIIFHFF